MAVDISKLPVAGKQASRSRKAPAAASAPAPAPAVETMQAPVSLKGRTTKGMLILDHQDRATGLFGTFYLDPAKMPESWTLEDLAERAVVVLGIAR